MRKVLFFISALFIFTSLCFASDESLEPLINRVYDSDHKCFRAVDIDKGYLRDGEVYSHWYVSSDFDISQRLSLTITPATGTRVHVYPEFFSTGEAEFKVLEGPTVVAGTTVAPYNRNRSSSSTASCTLVSNDYIATPSVTIDYQVFGTAYNSFPKHDFGYELSAGTGYMFILKSLEDDKKGTLKLIFTEN